MSAFHLAPRLKLISRRRAEIRQNAADVKCILTWLHNDG